MTEPLDHQAEEREIATAAGSPEWNRAEMEPAAAAEPPIRKERLFSPMVLIGWGVFTLVMYFGIQFVGTVVKASVREAVATSTRASTPGPNGNLVIVLPNGKRITIRSDNPRGPTVTVTESPPVGKAPVIEPVPPIPERAPTPKRATR